MRPESLPGNVDVSKPTAARMYDYYLGGASNFEVDRAAAEKVIEAMPFTVAGARTNRSWLGRAVRYLAEQGVRQFLDLGSGVPTVGNVHEIAQAVAPDTRVFYVDVDPVAVAHSNHILTTNSLAASACADLRDVAEVLARAGEFLDFDEPIGLVLAAVLHFVPDSDEPDRIVADYLRALVPGSHVALSHMSHSGRPASEVEEFVSAYASTPNPVTLRSKEEILALLAGVDLVEPGLVAVPLWRPDDATGPEDELFPGFAAVGRKG